MEASVLKLQQIVRKLPIQFLKEVIDFAEFLSLKAEKENDGIPEKFPRARRLELPIIKNVKFIGDPLLRREDLYDEWGR